MAAPNILLVSDNDEISNYIREILVGEQGYSVSVEFDAIAATEAMKEQNFDLVILKTDTENPHTEELVKNLKKIDPEAIIIGLLEREDPEIAAKIPRMGVYDTITIPINEERLNFLVKKGAELHALAFTHRKLYDGLKEQNSALQKQNTFLAKRIEESTKNLTRLYEDLRSTYMRTIKTLAQAIDARDHYTHSHSQNVAKYAVAIAEELNLSAKDIEIIREACELHDLGKIGIQDNILVKPAALNEEEWKLMKEHPQTAVKILQPLTFLHAVIDLIQQHHEHFDGTGYPSGLKGEEITLGARIIHLADAYEAMTSARSYRKTPLTKEQAVAEIKKFSGTQFDPQIVKVFLKVVNKL